jgi:hypothetical protein
MGLSFTIASGLRQRIHSRIRVPWHPRPNFIVSDGKVPFCRLLRLAGPRCRYSIPPPHSLGCSHGRHHVEQLIVLFCPVGCRGNLVFSNFLPRQRLTRAICCNGNVISGPLLCNGRLALASLFRLSVVTL